MTRETRQGVWAALGAYLLWGAFPLYFKAVAAVPAVEVLGHRIAWSALFTIALVLVLGKAEAVIAVFRDRRRLAGLAASAVCITINWGFYIWAVAHGRTLDASLGYYIYPLFSVLLGAVLLRERLNRRQMAALALVGVGVSALALSQGGVPWLVLAFPLSFGLYGLLRKLVPVESLVGLTVETLLLAPFAIGWLLTRPDGGALAGGGAVPWLLVAAGPVTALPLMLFAHGARRLSMATLGLMQYLNPTLQMAVAVGFLGERFTAIHGITFACIWAGLLLYSWPERRAPAG